METNQKCNSCGKFLEKTIVAGAVGEKGSVYDSRTFIKCINRECLNFNKNINN